MLVSSRQKVAAQKAVIADLRKRIEHLEGFQRRRANIVPICDIVDEALPYKGLPLGCVHEVKGKNLASAIAFASLLSTRISHRGAILYVAPDHSLYPLGLLPSGAQLDQWIHIYARHPKDFSWTVLEAIRCTQVRAVLAVTKAADLTFCRSLQLAAEASGVTGFLINQEASFIASTITRWQISPAKSPQGRGLGEPFWKLELLYCRGGRPGKWVVACRQGSLDFSGCVSEGTTRPAHHTTISEETALAG